ncbi:uncharacterized protein EI90DRAFT_3055977 [Cantharellus anzutake]|uniref:uncharacterized protein n=1 Tax=Cantharellus anzutake TaxID=1750568 RepID=UPI001908B61D|nr:uncharacterized protein EI90DRAFT_3055977 [Cantharellus anzutake]KAF8331945.1 hypothetical protein EI90DRAFT_3055977 [Cantharellus anzutake]
MEEGNQGGNPTLFGHLQTEFQSAARADQPYQCSTDEYRKSYSGHSARLPYRAHECINFSDVDMFEKAQEFYREHANDNITSVMVTKALALILLVVPLLPLSLLVLVWSSFVLLIDAFSQPEARHKLEFIFPVYRVALNMSIWIVYVPSIKLAGRGGLSGLMLPSLSPGFQHLQADTENKGNELIKRREDAYSKLKTLLARASQEEDAALEKVYNVTINSPREEFRKAFEDWKACETNRKFIDNRVNEVKLEIKEIRELAKTQACMQNTGYKGIADWAKDAWNAYDNLITAMTAVCGLGAGLSYTSMTSASRGNVSYMCYSFALFTIGLMLTSTVQGLLTWCSRLHDYPFTTPYIWEIIIAVGVYGALGSVVAAMLWLMVSIQVLDYPIGSFPHGAAGEDAPLVFTIPPQPVAYATYGLFGAGILVTLVIFLLFCSANGYRTLVWRRSEERKRVAADIKTLQDYDPAQAPSVPHRGGVLFSARAIVTAPSMAQQPNNTAPPP